jgi:hypothetical protein
VQPGNWIWHVHASRVSTLLGSGGLPAGQQRRALAGGGLATLRGRPAVRRRAVWRMLSASAGAVGNRCAATYFGADRSAKYSSLAAALVFTFLAFGHKAPFTRAMGKPEWASPGLSEESWEIIERIVDESPPFTKRQLNRITAITGLCHCQRTTMPRPTK